MAGKGVVVSAWGRDSRRGGPMRIHVPHAGVTTRPQLMPKRAGLELRTGLRPGGTEFLGRGWIHCRESGWAGPCRGRGFRGRRPP